MVKYLLYKQDWGVYLGCCLGLGFWSNLDPAAQDRAVVFDSPSEVTEYLDGWEDPGLVDQFTILPVEVAQDNGYASLEECVKAGVPRWAVEHLLH